MRKLILSIFVCAIITIPAFCQITVTKTEGSSVVTVLSMGIKVNKGSTLIREKITINDAHVQSN